MSDIGDVYAARKEDNQKRKSENRKLAADTLIAARVIANKNGMAVIQHSDSHYQIKHRAGWILDVYPGNQRLYRPKGREPKAPHLKGLPLEADWDLVDVVKACVQAEEYYNE